MFEPNEGRWDRGLRLLLGIALGTLALTGAGGTPMTAVAAIMTVTLFVTAAVGSCPLYTLLGIDTRPPTGAEG